MKNNNFIILKTGHSHNYELPNKFLSYPLSSSFFNVKISMHLELRNLISSLKRKRVVSQDFVL